MDLVHPFSSSPKQPESGQQHIRRGSISMHTHICCSCYARRNSNASSRSWNTTDKALNKDEQIAYIDAEISRAEDAIVGLVKQRALLKRRRNDFSPAVNLPPEILALIFEFACLPDSEDEHVGRNPQAHGHGVAQGLSIGVGAVTPFFLGTVCSAWRNIAHNASQLWSTIIIHVSNNNPTAQATVLQEWLSHSGQRPLSIKLVEDEASDNENDDDSGWGIDVTSTAVITVLAAHSHKWHTLDLFLPSTWKKTLAQVQHNLPQLTSLTLRFAEGSPTLARVDAFQFAPRLREVTLIGYSPVDTVLPWAQLHRIDGQHFSVADCLDTLHLCPQLRHCQLEQLYLRQVAFIPRPIHHGHLESFELILETTSELPALFGAITLPNLKELVLSLPDEEPLLRDIVPLIRRSACGLRRLHLVGITPNDDELIEVMKVMPSLEVLLLLNPAAETGGRFTERILDLMHPNRQREEDDGAKDRTCLLPKLEKLEYQGAIAFTSHALVEFLLSRWRLSSSQETTPADPEDAMDECSTGTDVKVSRLLSVVLTTTKRIKFDRADAKIIQGLMEEGMHLEFRVDPNADGPGW